MNARKAQLAAFALSVVTVVGCGSFGSGSGTSSGTGATSSPTPKAPQEVLLASVPGKNAAAYHFVVKNVDGTYSGVLDAGKKTISVGFTERQAGVPFTLDLKFLIIDRKTWTKISFTPSTVPGLPRLPKKWMLLDPSKIKDKASSPLSFGDDQSDPGYTLEVVENASNVTEPSAGHFAGVTDLGLTNESDIIDDASLKALGAKAKTVPFTAVVDAKGLLTSLILKIPGAGKTKAHTYSVTYDGYGTTATPGVPSPGDQQPAVPSAYDLLNG